MKKFICITLVTCTALNFSISFSNALEVSNTQKEPTEVVFYDIPINDIQSGNITSNNINDYKVSSNNDITTYELNMWERKYSDFSFDKKTRANMEKKLNSYAYTAISSGLTALVGAGIGGSIAGGVVGNFIADVANESVDKFYSQFGKTVYGTTIVGKLGTKLRVGIYLYKDKSRNNLVHSDTWSTNSYK